MGKEKMVTLKDIAQECNVSFSTVSKALKGSSEISIETRNAIQAKAKEMGYHPNIAARTLRTNRTYDLCVIFEDKTGSGFQHQYFAKIISGIQAVAQKNGYEITFTGREDPNFDYYTHIKSRNFDGVAILSADFESEQIQTLIKSEIPSVTLDYIYDQEHAAILSDNLKGMKELTEYLISMGHKKFGIIHGEKTRVTIDRLDIFFNVLKEHNLTCPNEYIAQGLYHDPITSQEATAVLLDLPEPPTCILYPDDYAALGGIRELNSRGLVPGKDISISGYDGIMLTSLLVPPLTTYEQDGCLIGNRIAESLINQIENAENNTEPVTSVTGRLIKGGSIVKL
ncbi:MAG: LacI family transcriptional regulator [Treponema sp.]|nr:LacI family transcriptional regulator [Treponema sp.]